LKKSSKAWNLKTNLSKKNIHLFEQGLQLSKFLKKHLDAAERKIEILSKDSEGNLKIEEFKEDE